MAFKDEVGSLDRIAHALEGIAGGGSSIESLSDVDLSNPTDGQTLVYNATSGKWENGSSSGGGSGVLVVHLDGETLALDKTYAEIKAAAETGMVVISDQTTEHNMMLSFVMNVAEADDYSACMVASIGFQNDHGTATPTALVFASNSADGYPVLRE